MVQNASKKGGENLRKLSFGRLGGHWNPQGAPEATNLAEKEPKEPPRPPKCSPGDTQKWKNGDPEATNLAKMEPKGPQGFQNAAQDTPKTGKMKTKASPEFQKCSPGDVQGTPRALKMNTVVPMGHRTEILKTKQQKCTPKGTHVVPKHRLRLASEM